MEAAEENIVDGSLCSISHDHFFVNIYITYLLASI